MFVTTTGKVTSGLFNMVYSFEQCHFVWKTDIFCRYHHYNIQSKYWLHQSWILKKVKFCFRKTNMQHQNISVINYLSLYFLKALKVLLDLWCVFQFFSKLKFCNTGKSTQSVFLLLKKMHNICLLWTIFKPSHTKEIWREREKWNYINFHTYSNVRTTFFWCILWEAEPRFSLCRWHWPEGC